MEGDNRIEELITEQDILKIRMEALVIERGDGMELDNLITQLP